MKKNRLLCAAVSLILSCFSFPATALPVFAEGEEDPVLYSYNDLQYRIEEGHIVITSCAVDATKLEIPEEVDGYPVTATDSKAFSGATNLISVTLPDSLTDLGDRTFLNCTSLTSVTLPDGLTEISNNTFNGCTSLKSVRIPDSVQKICTGAFQGCTALADITFPPHIERFQSDVLTDTAWLNQQSEGFVYVSNVLYCWKGTMPENTELTLDKSITVIADSALSGEKNLTAVTFHDGDTYIGWAAFKETGIETLTLPENCKMDSSVFENCTSLKSLTIPGSVKTIEYNAFFGCTALESLTIGEGIEKIDSLAFVDCNALTSISVPASILEIGGSAFGLHTEPSGGFIIYLKPVEGFTVYGYKGTAAEEYAEQFGLTFVERDDPPSVTVYGDVNSDEQFSIADAVLLQKYLLTIEVTLPNWAAGDLDKNGTLNAMDLSLMKQKLFLVPDAVITDPVPVEM